MSTWGAVSNPDRAREQTSAFPRIRDNPSTSPPSTARQPDRHRQAWSTSETYRSEYRPRQISSPTTGTFAGTATLDVAGAFICAPAKSTRRPPSIARSSPTIINQAAPPIRLVTIVASGSRPFPCPPWAAGYFRLSYQPRRRPPGPDRHDRRRLGRNGSLPGDLITGSNLPLPVTRPIDAGNRSVTSAQRSIGDRARTGHSLRHQPQRHVMDRPTGTDITSGGVPAKSINPFATTVTDQAGASIDLAGGGDFYRRTAGFRESGDQ